MIRGIKKRRLFFENGVWGVAPMRVVSRWCRCIVQRLCATDCKHPCLVRAAAPYSAPARMPGVYAKGSMQGRIQVVEQSRCRTHRQQTTTVAQRRSHQSVLKEIGNENKQFLKKQTFSINCRSFLRLLFFSSLLEKPTEKCYNCKGLSSDAYVCRLEING